MRVHRQSHDYTLQVRDWRLSRRGEALAKARRQQLAKEDLEKAAALDKSAVAVAMNVRRALALEPGSNLRQLEYIRLTLGLPTGTDVWLRCSRVTEIALRSVTSVPFVQSPRKRTRRLSRQP
jgi:hypothetical protein